MRWKKSFFLLNLLTTVPALKQNKTISMQTIYVNIYMHTTQMKALSLTFQLFVFDLQDNARTGWGRWLRGPYFVGVVRRYCRLLCFRMGHVVSEIRASFFFKISVLQHVPNRDLRQMACVAKDIDSKYYRGKILESGEKEASLFFVDFGVTKYVKWNDIKPLWFTFAELPPLAIKCRLKGFNF